MSSSSRRPEPPPSLAATRLRRFAVAVAAVAVIGGLAALQALREFRDDAGVAAAAVTGPVRYRHPGNAFALTLPAGWAVRPRDADRSSNDLAFVGFRGPDGLELWVRLRDLGHDRPERLADELRAQAEQMSLPIEPIATNVAGRIAFVRRLGMYGTEVQTVDLLVGTTNHHLQIAAPKGRLDAWAPVWQAIVDSYEPLPASP
ncbi:MAG: hypothetical protein N2652_10415 [Kiritimatiellae bacterium]|nr:hypothetical protein [Kiritimatiellia bacterium]